MPVRIGFDMDGVLADFATAFRDVETRLFGASSAMAAEAPEVEAQQEEAAGSAQADGASATPREMRRRRDAIWSAIHDTPDFWTTLRPHDPDAVRRIHDMMIRYGWEVFFITQRPSTLGETVQRQTQRWLHRQGFDLPSVLVISGSRGAAAGALRLDYHVDDSPQNCLDVVSDSRARPILIVPEPDAVTENSAKRLRIAVTRSIGDALDALERVASGGRDETPRLLNKLSRMVGWKT
jgi:uncharacterized protein